MQQSESKPERKQPRLAMFLVETEEYSQYRPVCFRFISEVDYIRAEKEAREREGM